MDYLSRQSRRMIVDKQRLNLLLCLDRCLNNNDCIRIIYNLIVDEENYECDDCLKRKIKTFSIGAYYYQSGRTGCNMYIEKRTPFYIWISLDRDEFVKKKIYIDNKGFEYLKWKWCIFEEDETFESKNINDIKYLHQEEDGD